MSKREQWCFCRRIVFNVILNIGKDRMIFGLSDFSQRIASLFFFLFFVLFVFVNVFVCLSFFILFFIYLIHFNIASNLPFFFTEEDILLLLLHFLQGQERALENNSLWSK